MSYQQIIDLSRLMERQPDTKQGYFNQLVAIKRVAKITKQEFKEASNEIRTVSEELEEVRQQLDSVDIRHKELEECKRAKQNYIDSLRVTEISVMEARALLGSQLIEISYNLDGLATDHELAQVIGCNINKVKTARAEYEKRGEQEGFLHYALFVENVEGEIGADWKEGLLFDLIIDYMVWAMKNTPEGKEASDKAIDWLVYEQGLDTYKAGPDGQLRKDYPELKLVSDLYLI